RKRRQDEKISRSVDAPGCHIGSSFFPYALWTIEGMGKEPAPVSSTKIAASPARWPAPSPKRERGRALGGGRRSRWMASAGPCRVVGFDGSFVLSCALNAP